MTGEAKRFIILGNPENRRVTLFQEALVSLGHRPAHVVSWLEFLRDPAALADVPIDEAVVRIESFGENFEVEKALLELGYPDAVSAGCTAIEPDRVRRLVHDTGLILAPRQHHLGFLVALRRLEKLFAERPAWRPMSAPASIAELFDKRLTSRRYEALGVPVPTRIEGVQDVDSLRRAMRHAGCRAAYVKLSCGSSASCLVLFELHGAGRESLFTSIELAKTGWYNNLRVRRIVEHARVNEVLDFLLREGSHIEHSVPKAKLDNAYFDCRILAIRGEPVFTVVRQNKHPITNLHLGGWRGELSALEAAAPREVIAAAHESCRAVAREHDCLHVGIDLMYEPGFTGHRVLEANAFGDLLPGLKRDGRSVYQWELAGYSPTVV